MKFRIVDDGMWQAITRGTQVDLELFCFVHMTYTLIIYSVNIYILELSFHRHISYINAKIYRDRLPT